MSSAVIFPGQGSQHEGMAKELLDSFPKTKIIFEEASDSIKEDLIKMCTVASNETLQLTQNAQPALLVTAFAWYCVVKEETGFSPSFGAGHSLGEYTALLAACSLTLTQAVSLVRVRGKLMQEAVPQGRGKMAAILGLEDEKVTQLCKESSKGDEVVVAANFNAPLQVVISGGASAVDKAIALASQKDSPFFARKVVELKVSAPFHSPLMTPVAKKFEANLQNISWNKLLFPIAFNVNAQVLDKPDIVSLMKTQLDSPVLWTQCMKALCERGVQTFVEPGPSVLTGLGKRINKQVSWISVESVGKLKETMERKI